MKNFLHSLKPVFEDDIKEWNEILKEFEEFPIFWYSSAGEDIKPLIEIANNQYPLKISRFFPIYTDYSIKILNKLKYIYKYFEKDYKFMDLDIYQMIPLRYFSKKDIENIRNKYPNNFHSFMTSSVIPDEKWHFVYINGCIDEKEYTFLYGFIENITFYKEIVEKFGLNIEIFCALRVGGKSGSWYDTHNPKGEIFKEIKKGKIKPKFWIADENYKLKKVFKQIKFDNKYKKIYFFETKW